jgi:ABC-2 type transport system ATP-binding protein
MDSNESVVQLEHVSRRYGRKLALDDVCLTVPTGRIFGLVGPNGAGKTTIIKHILGLLRAQTGTVRVLGLDPVAHPCEVLGRIGYLSEDRDLPPWMTVSQLLAYCRAFYPRWDVSHAEKLRRLFQIPLDSRVRTLSKGELAKTGLMVALAYRPELLVLDEPSSGLDPVVRRELLETVVRSEAEEGHTVLLSSHLLDEVARVSHYVAMIANGRIVLRDTLEGLLAAYRSIVVRLPTPKTPKDLPGVISAGSATSGEWKVLCQATREALLGALRAAGGQVLSECEPSLEEIFHAHVAGSGPDAEATGTARPAMGPVQSAHL